MTLHLIEPEEMKQLLEAMRRSLSLLSDTRANLRLAVKEIAAHEIRLPSDIVQGLKQYDI